MQIKPGLTRASPRRVVDQRDAAHPRSAFFRITGRSTWFTAQRLRAARHVPTGI